MVILTPDGTISKYLFGVTFAPKDLYGALKDASYKQVGSPIQQLILLCFHYNPITGKYSRSIIVILRVLGIATILGLFALVVLLICRAPVGKTNSVATAPLPAVSAHLRHTSESPHTTAAEGSP